MDVSKRGKRRAGHGPTRERGGFVRRGRNPGTCRWGGLVGWVAQRQQQEQQQRQQQQQQQQQPGARRKQGGGARALVSSAPGTGGT